MIPEYIIIHHAASGTAKKNGDITMARIREIHQGKGWRKEGYHELVRLDGNIEHGRAPNEQGAHCPGYNNRSLGICFAGNAMYHEWTAEQERAGIELISRLAVKYQIPVENILGHNETPIRTKCPGALTDMRRVRELVMAAGRGGEALHPEPDIDYLGMFRSICDIFDDPQWNDLPPETQRLVKDLRYADPFASLTRVDLQ